MEKKDLFENQLLSLTTIILTDVSVDGVIYNGNASGFYYTIMTPTDPANKGPQWHRIDGQWLITNRHVVFPTINGKECCVDRLVFCLRETLNDQINWVPIVMERKDIISNTRLHKDKNVDVVAIDVSEIIKSKILESKDKPGHLLIPGALSNKNLPENQPLLIDVTTDIVVASYPKGFYDEVNKFPIVKSGIIASGWGFDFKGLQMFEIDAQLFPGSSGGLVISKPTNIAMFDGHIHSSVTKQFVFLGVYSGEFQWEEKTVKSDGKVEIQKRSYGLGNVWYSYLIPEIIKNGCQLTQLSFSNN